VTDGWDTGTLVTDAFDEQVISEFRARGGVVSGLQDLSLLWLHHVGAKSGSSPSVASAVGRTSRQIPVVILELLAKVDHPPPGETRP
jgi:hypothetical protein